MQTAHPIALGAWIREQRLVRGMTLREAAELVGVQMQTFWRWENGHSNPAERLWARVAVAFGVPLQVIQEMARRAA